MKIRIRKEGFGYCVDRLVGNWWKRWLPPVKGIIRGEEIYDYYKTPDAAEKAARNAKKDMERGIEMDNPRILEI